MVKFGCNSYSEDSNCTTPILRDTKLVPTERAYPSQRNRMQLNELIDVETQVLADRDVDAKILAERDSALRARLPADADTRAKRLIGWIHGVRGSSTTTLPGQTIQRTYAGVRVFIAIIGALIGWGVAAAALHYQGEHPINVLTYLWIFVFLQIIGIGLLLASSVLLRVTSLGYDRLPTLAFLQSIVRAFTRMAWNRWAKDKDEERRARATRIWNQLLERRSLYHPAEQWLLLEIFQWGAIGFHVAAIIRLVTLVMFSDLAFAWSTTLDLSPATFQSYMEALSLPWQAIAPNSVPSEALVDATRYSRLDGAYLAGESVAAANAQLAGAWWRFLLAATVVWGLAPRVFVLAYARLRLHRFMSSLRFQTPEFAAVDRRLTRSGVNIESLTIDPGDDSPLPTADDVTLDTGERTRCLSTIWREADIDEQLVRDWLDAEFGYETVQIHRTGSADYAADEAFYAVIREEKPRAIAIVVEAWESPEKATLNFVKRVRGEAGDDVGIVVLLIDGTEFDHKLWTDYLGQLRDPYLQVTKP